MVQVRDGRVAGAEIYFRSIVDTVREPLVILDERLRVVSANRAFYRLFRVSPGETEQKPVYELGSGQWGMDGLRHLLERIIPFNERFRDFEVDYDFPVIGHRVMLLNGRRIDQEKERGRLILLAIEDVSERRKAEEAMRESEEKYRTLVERANDGIIIMQDGVITYANPRMAELGGSSVERIVGTRYIDHLHPGELPKVADYYRRRRAGEKVSSFYETVLRRNGDAVQVEISVATVNYRGKPADMVIIRDITERKRAEEELRRKEAEFRSLADNSPDIIIRYGKDNRFLFVNPEAEPLFGHPRSAITGKRGIELGLPKQGVDFWEALIQEVFATKKGKAVEFDFPPGERYYHARLVPEFDERGNAVSVLCISRDITGMRKNEEILRRNEYELRSLADNSPDLIIRLNRESRYEYVNSAYERLTGISKERTVGKTNEELGMPPQLVDVWQRALTRVIGSGQEYSMEFSVTSLFGKRHFATRLIPEFATSGQVETVLAIARDITGRVHAEEQLRYVSFHDKVTGLFNRAFFEEEIRRIDTERELPISIIMGDVNNLKLVNDVFGHQEGDALLTAIAASVRKACRSNDIVARWGGDEFAVILPGTDAVTAGAVRSRITRVAAGQRGTVIRPSIALGIAVKEKRDQNIYHVIRRAEQAMYDNKLADGKRNEAAVIASLLARARERTKDLAVHIDRAREFARCFGRELGLDEDQIKNLLRLVELHDVGMVVIPQEILMKPGRLAPGEWEIVKRHPEAGYRVVRSFPDTARISDEILSHDERWDGTGYPRCLRGKEIPLLARIFALIEAYDNMTHPRHYAHTFTREEAVEELRRNAGSQFDPELVDIFIGKVIKNWKSARGMRV